MRDHPFFRVGVDVRAAPIVLMGSGLTRKIRADTGARCGLAEPRPYLTLLL